MVDEKKWNGSLWSVPICHSLIDGVNRRACDRQWFQTAFTFLISDGGDVSLSIGLDVDEDPWRARVNIFLLLWSTEKCSPHRLGILSSTLKLATLTLFSSLDLIICVTAPLIVALRPICRQTLRSEWMSIGSQATACVNQEWSRASLPYLSRRNQTGAVSVRILFNRSLAAPFNRIDRSIDRLNPMRMTLASLWGVQLAGGFSFFNL